MSSMLWEDEEGAPFSSSYSRCRVSWLSYVATSGTG